MRRASINLVAMVGCHGDMITTATVSEYLFLYSFEGIMSKFRKFLSWHQNFSVKLLKFYESLLPWQQGNTSYFYVSQHIISLNLLHGFSVYH